MPALLLRPCSALPFPYVSSSPYLPVFTMFLFSEGRRVLLFLGHCRKDGKM